MYVKTLNSSRGLKVLYTESDATRSSPGLSCYFKTSETLFERHRRRVTDAGFVENSTLLDGENLVFGRLQDVGLFGQGRGI